MPLRRISGASAASVAGASPTVSPSRSSSTSSRAPGVRPFDDGEEDSALVGVRELEQPVADAQSKRSTKTSISPPQGSPTPSASSSEIP